MMLLFPAVTLHPDLPDLERSWSPADLDVVVIGEAEPRAPDAGPPARGQRSNMPNLGRLQRQHLVIFGVPNVDGVPFHHGRQIWPGNAATSSEFTVHARSGPLARMVEQTLGRVHDVRGWTTLVLSTTYRGASTGFGQLSEREIETYRLMSEAEPFFVKARLVSARVPMGSLALAAVRADTQTGIAWLPNFHTDRIAWLEVLMQEWAELDREAFKGIVPWREQRQWLTGGELRLSEELEALRDERARHAARFLAEEERIERTLAKERADADRGARLLLTAQGDDLVAAVSHALTAIGFEVENMDEAKLNGQPKLEDLRLRIADRPGWEAVAEIKGHEKRGLRLVDVNQARRPRDRYRDETGRWPDLVMVVHNGMAALPPSLRSRPFDSSPADAQSLSDEGYWLVVPTTDLFRLLRDSPSLGRAALDVLADSRGVLSYP